MAAEYRRLDVPWPGPSKPSTELLAELPRADFHVAQSAFAERSLIEHGTETTEREISWLDRLIAGEHDGTPPSHPQEGSTQ